MPQAAKSGGSAAPKDAAGQVPEPGPPAGEESAHLRYVDTVTRVYPHIPITVQPGDVVTIPDPGDGRFEPTTKPVTRWPDNDPRSAPKPEPASDQHEGE